MNRYEFVEELRKALSGSLSANEIDGHARYYEEYIDMQIRKGKMEEEVLQELGNPRLLAKSMIDVSESKMGNNEDGMADFTKNNQENEEGFSYNKMKLKSWFIVSFIIVILLIVFGLIFSVIAILLKFFFPLILLILVVKMISKINKRL